MNALHGQEMNVIKKKRKNYVLLLMIQTEREASRKRRKEMPLIKDEERIFLIFLVQIKNFSKLENAIVREVVIWCLAV